MVVRFIHDYLIPFLGWSLLRPQRGPLQILKKRNCIYLNITNNNYYRH